MRLAFTSFQHGFFRSAKNVDLHNFVGVIWENVYPYNLTNMVHVFCESELYNGMILTIVVIGRCYAHFWQMLLLIIDSVIH